MGERGGGVGVGVGWSPDEYRKNIYIHTVYTSVYIYFLPDLISTRAPLPVYLLLSSH